MTNGPSDGASGANSAELIDAFKAPFSEREKHSQTQQNGLILFSFGRNGGFAKPTDKSSENVSVA
ncbi:MAG TPA: hypothetical protein V6C89_06690 [Drouetiella sp.]|jgi:hypothetical protein